MFCQGNLKRKKNQIVGVNDIAKEICTRFVLKLMEGHDDNLVVPKACDLHTSRLHFARFDI